MPQLVGALTLVFVCFCLMFLPESAQNWLVYQRNDILHGQLWRVLTGHLMHTNFWHFVMNAAGALAIAWLHGRYYSVLGWWLRLTYLMVMTSLGLLVFCPHLVWYVGLSGILHGLMVMGALEDVRRHEKTGWLLLIGVVAKITFEQWHGPAKETAILINAPVAVDAHLFGAIAALPGWLFCLWLMKKKGA